VKEKEEGNKFSLGCDYIWHESTERQGSIDFPEIQELIVETNSARRWMELRLIKGNSQG